MGKVKILDESDRYPNKGTYKYYRQFFEIEKDEEKIYFAGAEHETFFYKALMKADCFDVYHQALFYCLGIDRDTRNHIDSIYNFSERIINTECLKEGWITSGSGRMLRMAFNLFCKRTLG